MRCWDSYWNRLVSRGNGIGSHAPHIAKYMPFRHSIQWCSLVVLACVAACGSDGGTGPSTNPPTRLDAVTDLSRSAPVGAAIPGGVVVKVTDASGRPVQNAAVAFAVTLGNGSATPRLATTDSKGQASATWTLGTILGQNEVTATVTGVTTQIKFEATGTPGAVNTIAISPPTGRLLPNIDTLRVSAQSLDAFGNVTSPTPTFQVRDPSLLSIDASGLAHALRRGSGTYIVATAGTKTDSVLVTVLALGQSICTAAANPIELAVGQVITDASGQGFCVHATSTNAEYALVPYYNSGVPSATTQIEVRGQGVAPLGLPVASLLPAHTSVPSAPSLVPDDAFESRLRDRERAEAGPRLESARSWFRARRDVIAANPAATTAVPAVGDIMKLNANASAFCDAADLRTGRVVAITDKAIIVADTANPAGGFTDAEYRSIGVTFDTLVDPVDRAAFGAPSDIDNNGHVILFFTRAVNELTSGGSSSVVLGFFYQRDLFPKTASPGPCPGSNVAEMFYLLVPDSTGIVNNNKRTKQQVITFTNGTVAHEYQHLINASRRMYVNGAGTNFEEKWLDEGLAHTAEELNFWRASGRSPRANIDASMFNDSKATIAYTTFEVNNFRRYQTYLSRTESQAPIGFDANDDDLQTRGAIWNFLRFAADRLPAGAESAFWFNLVNSKTSGVTNLTSALGTAPNSLMRDWAISVFMDDNAASVDPRFQQASWNLRSALTGGGTSTPFPLVTRSLTDGIASTVQLAGGGVSFLRFSVPNGQDALLTVTSSGQLLPSTVQLAVVRVR